MQQKRKQLRCLSLASPTAKKAETLLHFFTWHVHMASDNPKSLLHLLVLYMRQVLLFALFTDIFWGSPLSDRFADERNRIYIFKRPTSLHAGVLQTLLSQSILHLSCFSLDYAKKKPKLRKAKKKYDHEWEYWYWPACRVELFMPWDEDMTWGHASLPEERQAWDKWNLDSNKNTAWYKTFKNSKRKDYFLQNEESLMLPVWKL